MALTHILVVADIARARSFYRDVLGATVYREYGGTSCVLQAFGTWLLLVTGGGPTPDKPTVTFAHAGRPGSRQPFDDDPGPRCARRPTPRSSARGAVFLAPLVESDWEIRGFFRDPDGHLLEISEAKGA